ncbi:MAG: carboxypeptidase-like regulatory domain-containing protein [Candidatus Eisenbacteria bacterium]
MTAAEDGSGVADAIVTAVDFGMYNTATDANGDYLLAGLTAEAYSVGCAFRSAAAMAAPEVVPGTGRDLKDFLRRGRSSRLIGSLDFTLANEDSLCLPLRHPQ